MFFIDYSLPCYSRYLLFLDAPFRYSWRHLIFFFHHRIIQKNLKVELLNPRERAGHFLIAFFEVLPIVGLAVALFDRLIFCRPFKVLQLGSHASKCRKELAFLVEKILPIYAAISKNQGKDPLHEAKKLEPFIPQTYIEEMKRLSQTHGTTYEQILIANTIIDTLALFGCSICAISETHQVYATNYFHSQGRGPEIADVDKSFWRYDQMKKYAPHLDKKSLCKMLYQVNYLDTINSIIFDGGSKEIMIAQGGDYAANRSYRRFKAKALFGESIKQEANVNMLARNLDWPMALLAPFTCLFIHHKTATTYAHASVGWPVILGVYSGMNEKGLSLAGSIVPSQSQAGIPNHFLFRKILEEAKNVQEALMIIDKSQPASAMNLVLSAYDGVARIELDPARKKIGASHISFGYSI